MKTNNNENGMDLGARNVGKFFLALIPWALGIGFTVWFGAWVGVTKYKHDISQEKRAAVYVGAETKPEEKLKIKVVKHDSSTITKADVNGKDLIVYARNDGNKLDYLEWHWKLISPDGTAISEGYTNQCPKPQDHGDKAECKMTIETDDRAATLQIWTSRRGF